MIIKPMNIAVSVFAILTVVAAEAAFVRDDADSADLLRGASRSISRIENKTASEWQKAVVFEEAGKHPVIFRAIFHGIRKETPLLHSHDRWKSLHDGGFHAGGNSYRYTFVDLSKRNNGTHRTKGCP